MNSSCNEYAPEKLTAVGPPVMLSDESALSCFNMVVPTEEAMP